jgi:CBS domain-containing protein
MIAKDIMTKQVRMIAPDADIGAAARIMVEAGISALPVADERGALIGIVSEGDLLRRAELRTTRRRSWWLELFSTPETLAKEYTKSHAKRVRDVMTRPVISITGKTPLAEIASVLERHGVKRVPVLEGAAVVGIVSRADLVKALAGLGQEAPAESSDGAIRNTFLQRYGAQPWAPAGGGVGFAVEGGVVTLSGLVNSAEQRAALEVMAETIPGVVKVENELRVLPYLAMGA